MAMKKRRQWLFKFNLFLMLCLLVSAFGPLAGLASAEPSEAPAGPFTTTYAAIGNITVQCVQGIVENDGATAGKTGLTVGTTEFNRYSYLKFEVPVSDEPITSAVLQLTAVNATDSPALGVYAGPNEWPTSASMSAVAAGENVVAASARNCPGVAAEALDMHTNALAVGDAVQLDVSGLINGPGTYTAILRATEYTNAYQVAAMNHPTEEYRPKLIVTRGEAEGSGEGVTTPNGAVANLTIQCVSASFENSGAGATLKVGTTDFNRYSYLKFDVPAGEEPITSAKLLLTSTQAVDNPNLGIYAGPNEWPTRETTTPVQSGENVVVASARNCPNVDAAPIDSHTSPLALGDVIELNLSSMIKEAGTYTVVLRVLKGEQATTYTFGAMAHSNPDFRPQLLVTYGGVPDSGEHEPDGPPPPNGCDAFIPSNNQRVWDGTNMGIQPGDIVCIEAGLRPSALRFNNFHGTAEAPITFKNYGGVVTIDTTNKTEGAAINIGDSSHFLLSGTGDPTAEYGFRLSAVDADSSMLGLKIGSKSTDFTVEHVEVFGAGFAGFMIKTDPVPTDPGTQRAGFTQYNTVLRNNYIHHTDGEGMYIGHSWHISPYQGMWVHELKGVRIHDNIIKNTGWDGLQLSAAVEDVKVYNNYIENYGISDRMWQANGIQIGSGTVGDFYNNVVLYGKGSEGAGVNNQGLGDLRLFNNLIVDSAGTGIINMARVNPEDPQYSHLKPIHIAHNTIVNPGSADGLEAHGIWFWNSVTSNKGNTAYNNLIVYEKVDQEDESRDYINLWQDTNHDDHYNGEDLGIDLTLGGNYTSNNIVELKFVDPANGNYQLSPDSPAVNFGADLSGFAWAADIMKDLYGNSRPNGARYDAGAAEATGADIPPAQDQVLLSGPSNVVGGDNLELILSLNSVTSSVYAKSAVVAYDPAQLSFIGASSLVDGFTVLQSTYGNGRIKIIEAGLGHPITGTLDLLKLQFQALPTAQTLTSSVYLADVQIADGNGQIIQLAVGPAHSVTVSKVSTAALDTLIAEAQALADHAPLNETRFGHYKQAVVDALQDAIDEAVMDAIEAATQMDVNLAIAELAQAMQQFKDSSNQTVNIGDLGIMAAHYGINSSDSRWSKVHMYDVNKNGIMDLDDLVNIARKLLDF